MNQTLSGLRSCHGCESLALHCSLIGAIPEVAKFAGELYVVQRTPAYIKPRNRRVIDMEKFRRKVARKKGWQFERQLNFNTCLTNSAKPGENLVNDGWTDMPRGLPSWARPAMGSWTSRPRAWRSRQPGSTSAPGLTSPSGTPAGQPS
ncbi:hypothetical protein MPDQ_005869 [Monascus purpureus]|uniref:Uncharacterized protein n=1 Tax=Monascus purpureus TaxID=5098 RepID=A0A507QZK3_MONPU|nr:hypothetical protein MPDQ_005869 [Monascus purpureus]